MTPTVFCKVFNLLYDMDTPDLLLMLREANKTLNPQIHYVLGLRQRGIYFGKGK